MIQLGPVVPRIISCDVFDTLLRRNGVAEPNRVRLIARRAAAMLAQERAIQIDSNALWRARIDIQRQAYRALDMMHPSGEVRFATMMEGMATSLGLGAAEADVLARAERAVELTQLAPNHALLAWVARRAEEGIRIIAISDTWHDAPTIRDMLDRLAPGNPVAKVYTSADFDATKRSAQIFPRIVAEEGVPANRFFHIGDDKIADESMPQSMGFQTHRVTRPRLTMLRRRLDGLGARVRGGVSRQ